MPGPLSIADFADKAAADVTPGTQLIGHSESENISMTPAEICKSTVAFYDFPSPLATWTVNHNRGQHPSVKLFNTAGREMVGEVVHVNLNQFQVLWAAATAGKARVS